MQAAQQDEHASETDRALLDAGTNEAANAALAERSGETPGEKGATDGGQAKPAKPVFTKARIATEVDVSLTFPLLYPGVEFHFILRMQLSEEGDKLRQFYLGTTQAERRAGQAEHNLDMLCDLIMYEPEGLGDFPFDDRALKVRALEYFGERNGDGKLIMAWLVNQVVGGYWASVLPAEYL